MFPKMAEILPEKEYDRFLMKKFTVSEDAVKMMRLRDAINRRNEYLDFIPGTYLKLIDKKSHQIVMSDTDMERRTNLAFLYHANGDVLIGGLGIGMIVFAIQDKPEVKSVTVVEKHQEIVSLVASELPLNNKVEVVVADAFKWIPPKKYDTIYMDIWNTLSGDFWPEHVKLARKYGRYLNRENPKAWYSSWRRTDFKRLAS